MPLSNSLTANLGRWCILLMAALAIGCRTPRLFSRASIESTHKIAALAPPVEELEEHRDAVKFLETISELEHGPELDDAIATFHEAETARHRSDPLCVALYADVALSCWSLLPSSDEQQATPVSLALSDSAAEISEPSNDLPWLLYHRSLERLMQEAVKFDLLDPQRGIALVDSEGNRRFIQITQHGFPWQPEDFNQLHVVRAPLRSHLKRYWVDPGLGVSMVAIRDRPKPTKHMGTLVPYSATAVLRPATRTPSKSKYSQVAYSAESTVGVLELHDPLRVTQFSDSNREWDLNRDSSAPLGFAQSHLNRHNVKSFLNPARDDEFAGLRMLEPYQPGKIPIVFVHGLLSDRLTWLDLINDLRHSPWISRHYQIWLYQYPTGIPFIVSATSMRNTLKEAVDELDPEGNDQALREMVLVGHSMGGLVSKLLISESQDNLWNSVATMPIDQVKMAPEGRQQVEAIFYFEPLPFVKRVIFIGSPHQGSQIATSWIGVLGSKLVHPSKDRVKATKTILHDNPGVFKDLEKHLPTSVDMLRPDNPVLLATYQLPVNPEVRLHTIIGTGRPLRDGTEADGVVPVESARHPGTISEKRIKTTHTSLPDDPETTSEVIRILHEHLEP